ncbi:unnamed protein product [Effrenium voratum]|nr:unnamed protein product [Effrenium voratum]
MKSWGLDFKEAGFRNFRFPAAADRLICWAPAPLARRLQWSFPLSQVNYRQGGSDHRPVMLEAVLTLLPEEPERASESRVSASPALLEAVMLADAEDSDSGEPGLLNGLACAATLAQVCDSGWGPPSQAAMAPGKVPSWCLAREERWELCCNPVAHLNGVKGKTVTLVLLKDLK